MPIIQKHEGNDDDDGDYAVMTKNNNNIEYLLLTIAEEAENWIFVCAWKSVLKIFNSNVIARVLGSCSVFCERL